MIQVTGSRAHRVWRCSASAVLPQRIDEEAEARSEPARQRGKGVHSFLEMAAKEGRESALARTSKELRPLCEAIDLDEMPMRAMVEVAMAWDWRRRRGRLLGLNVSHRQYHLFDEPPTEDEIPLTIDVIGDDPMGVELLIADYKTGHTRLPAPDEFGQLLIAASAARSVWPVRQEFRVALIQIREDGSSYWASRNIDPWSLDVFEEELKASMEAALSGNAEAREGAHCAHCPAIRGCPSKLALLRQMPESLARLGVGPPEQGSTSSGDDLIFDARAITMAKAARAYQEAERIEEMMRLVKAEVCGLAWHEPIPLPDGRIIEPHTTTRRSIDARKAAVVLERHYGREAAMQALELETSFAAIQRLVAEKRKDGEKLSTKKGDGLLDRIEAELERAGAIESKTTENCSPHVPRKKK